MDDADKLKRKIADQLNQINELKILADDQKRCIDEMTSLRAKYGLNEQFAENALIMFWYHWNKVLSYCRENHGDDTANALGEMFNHRLRTSGVGSEQFMEWISGRVQEDKHRMEVFLKESDLSYNDLETLQVVIQETLKA